MDAPDQKPAQDQPEPETQWEYTSAAPSAPEASDAPAAADAPAPQSQGDVEWTASEFIAHHKGVGWYAALVGIAIVVGGLVYLIARDLVSIIVIAIFVLIVAVAAARQPRVVTYRLDRKGLTVGQKVYPYGVFKAFSLIEEGPFASITFTPLSRFTLPLSIYFSPEDEEKIINSLASRLPMQPASQDFVDTLMRHARF